MIKAAVACIATFIAGLSVAAVAMGQGNPPVNALSVAPSSTATDVRVVTRTLSAPTVVKTRVEQVAVASPPTTVIQTATVTATVTATATKTETAEPAPTMLAFDKKGKSRDR